MRATAIARWASCALALSICLPSALADKTARSLADCTSFDQEDKGNDAVAFTIHNSCTVPVDCSVSWRLVCAPDPKTPGARKRHSSHTQSAKLSLQQASVAETDASAESCGDDGWAVDTIEWACQPN